LPQAGQKSPVAKAENSGTDHVIRALLRTAACADTPVINGIRRKKARLLEKRTNDYVADSAYGKGSFSH